MKYFLFVNFDSGLMHNNIYKNLEDLHESITQLIQDEELKISQENVSSATTIRKHLEKFDDYSGQLSNGTWYHIQPHPIFI